MNKMTARISIVSLLLAGATLMSPAQAAFLGTTFDYCTDFVSAPPVSDDPSDCDGSSVGGSGSGVLIGAGIEIPGSAGRSLDIGDTTIDILWPAGQSSPSDDLFVLTNLIPFTGLTLVSANIIDVAFTFDGAAGSMGFLVQSPQANGSSPTTVSFAVDFAASAPEPGPLAMLAIGLLGLGLRSRRRARRA